jgi:hypothetical protein
MGVAIRFWADIVVPGKGTYYGDYPQLGLLEKIRSLKIAVVGERKEVDITPHIYGDSSIKRFYWRKYDAKGLSYGYYSNLNCYALPFFPGVDSLVATLNNQAGKLERIPNYDFIFWLDKMVLSAIDFKPDHLSLDMTLSDSTGKQVRRVVDKWKIE